MKRYSYIVGILFFVAGLGSCYDNSECIFVSTNQIVVEFRNDTMAVAPVIFQIRVMESDSILYQNDSTFRTRYQLPLNPFSDTTRYLFNTNAGLVNLDVVYEREQKLLHPDCGMETIYELDTVIAPFARASRITKNALERPVSKNIEILL